MYSVLSKYILCCAFVSFLMAGCIEPAPTGTTEPGNNGISNNGISNNGNVLPDMSIIAPDMSIECECEEGFECVDGDVDCVPLPTEGCEACTDSDKCLQLQMELDSPVECVSSGESVLCEECAAESDCAQDFHCVKATGDSLARCMPDTQEDRCPDSMEESSDNVSGYVTQSCVFNPETITCEVVLSIGGDCESNQECASEACFLPADSSHYCTYYCTGVGIECPRGFMCGTGDGVRICLAS